MDDKNERKLDELLMAARMQYRVPPEPSRERMWAAIEEEAFAPPVARRRPGFHWVRGWQMAAASLLIGLVVGRYTSPASRAAAVAAPAANTVMMPVAAQPFRQTTEEVLGRTAVLLAALRSTELRPDVANQMSEQASRLLGRIRLLIDSPAANDPQMLNLLLDLETTLAQVARMQPSRGKSDVNLINDAVAERDIVPRIQSVVVDLSAGAY